jgi:fibronectin type 3 domain-containing protein
VELTWDASTSADVVGYNVYRADGSGGPYTKLNGFPVGLTFRDETVQASRVYFYVVTSVTAGGLESAFSNEVMAVIPAS